MEIEKMETSEKHKTQFILNVCYVLLLFVFRAVLCVCFWTGQTLNISSNYITTVWQYTVKAADLQMLKKWRKK